MTTVKTLRLVSQILVSFSLVSLAFLLFYTLDGDGVVYSNTSNSTKLFQMDKLSATHKETLKNTHPALNKESLNTTVRNMPKSKQNKKLRTNKTTQQTKKIPITTETKKPSKTNSNTEGAHGKSIKAITESADEAEDANNKTRYLIYLCDRHRSCGGWGDRQRGLVAASVLAIVTGRKFGINMSYPCDIKLFYIPNEINWYIKTHEIRGRSWEMVDWMDNRGGVVDCESDFNKRHPSDVVFLKTNQDILSRLTKSPRYGHLVPKEYRHRESAFAFGWHKLMKLSFHMEEHIDTFMSNVPDKGDLVCAHIRMRKNPTIPNDGRAINSLSAIESLWRFLSQYENTSSRIFIASDSMDVRKSARDRFGSKELDTNGLVLHIDRQGKWSNACLGFEMSLLDQAVLTKCNVLVRSTSGFSARASMMSRKKQKLFMFRNGTIS